MTKFKAGDKFIPRKPKEEYPDIAWVGSMDEYDGKIQIVERIKGKYLIAKSKWCFHPDWCEKVEDTHIPDVGEIVGSLELPNNQDHIVEANKMIDWEQRRYELAKDFMAAIITGLITTKADWVDYYNRIWREKQNNKNN